MSLEIPFVAELALVKSYEDKKGDFHVVGYAATKDFDLQGDVISLDAMEHSKQDLIENSTMLYNHNPDAPIGKVVKQEIDQKGTLIDAIINKDSTVKETGAKMIDLIKQGILNKFSIHARVLDSVVEYVAEVGRTANVIRRMLLHEVSLVSVPANTEAKALEWYISKAMSEHKEGNSDMKKTVKKDVTPDVKLTALTHNSTLEEGEPDWGSVDKAELPANAFVENAPDVDPKLKSTWTYPHHWVKSGGELSEEGVFSTGDEFLHRGGLIAAWSAAQGGRTGEKAAPEIISHLEAHRKAIGLGEEPEPAAPKTAKKTPAPEPEPVVEPKVEDEVGSNEGGFPAPDTLHSMWKDYCKGVKISKTTDPVDVKDHWNKFCKDNDMPEGFAFPYPAAAKTAASAIVVIAEDLMKHEDEIIVGLGSELKNLIIGMLEQEVPEPDMSASKEADPKTPAEPAADPAVEPEGEVKKNLQTDKDGDQKPAQVKRKGMVDAPETGKKKETLEKQMAGMNADQRLRFLMEREGQAMGR